ncbi:efflux RND transporter periplasmic adaptor subunit (plasmid) [Sphingomonas naphthae]|uniref:Efflux RND transporter periplasmic adaptor subunit n=1 Tax=Sphingomonas naphthae TaxID=1813468 RepID=A0ABY7TRC6_9SPHN|nr:efflux RND transporter periplasmic adaptor subunit [Sphingomonas naphthae]WCT75733.1 efflux RND transporter periplasmic adaptor subunit [Sphingomonas naphthae]
MDKRQTYALGGTIAAALAGALAWWNYMPAAPAPVSPVPAQSRNGMLVVPANQARQLGIQVQPAASATDAPLADLPAMIAPPPNARVAVAASLPGVVMRTMVVEGDTVRRGQALAVISSRDVLSLNGDLTRAGARLGVAQSNANRLSQLDREGIIAGARADEARALAAEARADVSEKSRILRLVNGHGGSGTYTLVTPIAGRVTSANIQAGSPVEGTTAPYVIDAVDRYEVEAQLPERLVGVVRPGMTIRLGDLRGTITAVGSTIDPATRSAMVKATLPAGSAVVAGRATNISVFGPAPAGAVSVPQAALTSIDGKDVVFIATGSGFAVRHVDAGGASAGKVLLLSGVRSGERVVTSGTSALKALSQAR